VDRDDVTRSIRTISLVLGTLSVTDFSLQASGLRGVLGMSCREGSPLYLLCITWLAGAALLTGIVGLIRASPPSRPRGWMAFVGIILGSAYLGLIALVLLLGWAMDRWAVSG